MHYPVSNPMPKPPRAASGAGWPAETGGPQRQTASRDRRPEDLHRIFGFCIRVPFEAGENILQPYIY